MRQELRDKVISAMIDLRLPSCDEEWITGVLLGGWRGYTELTAEELADEAYYTLVGVAPHFPILTVLLTDQEQWELEAWLITHSPELKGNPQARAALQRRAKPSR